MSQRVPVLVLLSLSAIAPALRSEEAKVALAKPTFSGTWTLDPERSDDAGARMQEAMSEGHGRGGFMGVPEGRGSGGGGPLSGGSGAMGGGPGGPGVPTAGGFGAPPSREQMEAMRAAMDDALHATRELAVTQSGISFEIVLDGDRVVRLYADGRKNRGSTGVDKKTRWEADKLVTVSKVSASFGATVRITETWAMVAPGGPAADDQGATTVDEGQRLAITTRLEGGPFDKPVVIRRLYARSVLP